MNGNDLRIHNKFGGTCTVQENKVVRADIRKIILL